MKELSKEDYAVYEANYGHNLQWVKARYEDWYSQKVVTVVGEAGIMVGNEYSEERMEATFKLIPWDQVDLYHWSEDNKNWKNFSEGKIEE